MFKHQRQTQRPVLTLRRDVASLQRLETLKRLPARSAVMQRLAQRGAEEVVEHGVFRSAVRAGHGFHQLDLDVAGVMGRRRNTKLIDLRAHFVTQPFGRPGWIE